MSDDPPSPPDPDEPGPSGVDGIPADPEPGSVPDAVVAQANAIGRRALFGLAALLFAFGSCGIAYGVFRVAGGDAGGGTVLLAAGPGSPSPSPSPSPSGTRVPPARAARGPISRSRA